MPRARRRSGTGGNRDICASGAEIADAVSEGLDRYCAVTGFSLHAGVRAELLAHITAAIARRAEPAGGAGTIYWWNRE